VSAEAVESGSTERLDARKVKDALKKRSAHLLDEDPRLKKTFEKLFDIEKIDANRVRKRLEWHIGRSKEEDNLYRLGRRHLIATTQLARYNHKPRSFYTGLTISGLAVAASIALGIRVAAPFFFSLYLTGFLAFTLPLYLLDRWRERNHLKEAPAEESKAATDLDRALQSLIERCVREVTKPAFKEPNKDYVKIADGARLSSRVDEPERIATRYRPAIELHMLRTSGAAIGVTGERGMGKSELLRSFCEGSASERSNGKGGTIGIFVAIPAAFKGTQFLALVAERLACSVPGYRPLGMRHTRRRKLIQLGIGTICFILSFAAYFLGLLFLFSPHQGFRATDNERGIGLLIVAGLLFSIPLVMLTIKFFVPYVARVTKGAIGSSFVRSPIAEEAEQLVLRLGYAETETSQTEGSAGWAKIGLKLGRQRSLSSLPLTEASLVAEIESLSDKLERAGYRVIIGIDEMDKLEAGEATEEFLNNVKQLFAIPSCSFLVSVSNSAWASFVQRGINVRDALDSSLDAIERIDALDFLETRSLILHRGAEMNDAEILFCYALSGGLPREAMRCAQSLAMRNRDEEGASHSLDAVADRVLKMEFERLVTSIKSDLSKWEISERNSMLQLLDKATAFWQGRCQANNNEVSDDNSNASIPGRPEAWLVDDIRNERESTIARLDLMVQFFNVMRRLFCAETEAGIAAGSWRKNVNAEESILKLCEQASRARRLIETDPSAAHLALLEIDHILDKSLMTEVARLGNEARPDSEEHEPAEASLSPSSP